MQRFFQRLRPPAAHRPKAALDLEDALRIRWLGTAGHVVSTPTTTVLLDPFLTRPRFRDLLRPLEPDTSGYARWLPARVDAVLLGHSHYDHLMDAPSIAIHCGATIAGSASTAAFARAAGVPRDRVVVVPSAGATFAVGDIEVTFVPSLHGRIALGRVPFPGTVEMAKVPARFWSYRMGGAFGILLRAGGRTVYHNGSADLIDAELGAHRADVVLCGLAGRRATRDYLGRLTRALQPQVVIPTHHDAFFGPLEWGERALPGIDMDGFHQEIAALAPQARVLSPLYEDEIRIPLRGDARASGMA